MTPQAPELLAPAGSLKSMRYAFAYGADAVYAGQPRYSLRVRNNEFTHDNLALAMNETRQQGKQLFVVSNISPHNNKVKTYLKDLEPIIDLNPDALIMSDPGLIMMVREKWPETVIHLSVQSNVVNYASVKFWQTMGIQRIILSRELSLEEIAEIREECPDIELEVFVHGALCMAYSGRCLLSGYMKHRDANQGACSNACRWDYKVHDAKTDEVGDVVLIEEKSREGELMAMEEDEHGTYIFNSKDLCAVNDVEDFVRMNINCLKIEGRTKSHFYTARTTQIYRQAIDDAVAGKPFNPALMDALQGLANRGYTEGFLKHRRHDAYQNYDVGHSTSDKQKFAGEIIDYDSQTNLATIDVKNHFEIGDRLEVMLPSGNQFIELKHMEDRHGKHKPVAPGSGHIVRIPLETNDARYGLIIKCLT